MEIGAQCHDTQEAFKEYHEYIKSALASLEKGLLIDLHGRGKSDGVTQLGYCLSKEVLKNKDEHDLKNSSISNIGDKDPDALKGSHSLGAFLQNEGLKAVPSPAYPVPASGENSHFFFSIEIIDFSFQKMFISLEVSSLDTITINSALMPSKSKHLVTCA